MCESWIKTFIDGLIAISIVILYYIRNICLWDEYRTRWIHTIYWVVLDVAVRIKGLGSGGADVGLATVPGSPARHLPLHHRIGGEKAPQHGIVVACPVVQQPRAILVLPREVYRRSRAVIATAHLSPRPVLLSAHLATRAVGEDAHAAQMVPVQIDHTPCTRPLKR